MDIGLHVFELKQMVPLDMWNLNSANNHDLMRIVRRLTRMCDNPLRHKIILVDIGIYQ